jgi:6-pyruvoyltetrahydropterin/6-carboxytetrahydropterin synthase
MKYRSTKTYGHETGLSAAFRQWRAKSHCRLIHGYALSVHLEFECATLDANNWVVDFGSLKPVKEWLVSMFDHTLLVAVDDPRKPEFLSLADLGLADVRIVPATGCEQFAVLIAEWVDAWLFRQPDMASRGVTLAKVEVKEHGANSAMVIND